MNSRSERYLEARQGARTQVARGLGSAPASPGQVGPSAAADRLPAYGQRLAEFDLPPLPHARRMVADFRYWDVAAADFPMLAWRKAVGAVARQVFLAAGAEVAPVGVDREGMRTEALPAARLA